jgi:hypothetical protein
MRGEVRHNKSRVHASRRTAAARLLAMVRDARAALGLLTMTSVGGREHGTTGITGAWARRRSRQPGTAAPDCRTAS